MQQVINMPHLICGELAWQKAATTPETRKQFRSQILQQMGFRCMGFMRPNSAVIHIVHSMANCFMPTGATEYQGKDFGFVGDMDAIGNPQPVLISKEKPWKFEEKKVERDRMKFSHHFNNATGEDVKKIWEPADTTTSTNVTAPRMILLPSNLIEYVTSSPRTPWELYSHVKAMIAAAESPWTENEWNFLLEWCVVAAQRDTTASNSSNNSWLAFEFDPGASGDPAFRQWCSDRIVQTMKVDTAQPAPPPTAHVQQNSQAIDMVELAKEMTVAASKAVGSAVAAQMNARQGSKDTGTDVDHKGKLYSKYQVAAIKGFSGVHSLKDVPSIWGYFQTTKSTDEHRTMITQRMINWASSHGFRVDRSIFFPASFVEDVVKLNLNPGVCIAEYSSLDKGFTPMACRPRDAAAIEILKERERAAAASVGNRTFEEELKLNKSDPTTPPEDYDELFRMFVAFTALVFALRGDKSDLYQSMFSIIKMLDSEPVAMRRKKFTRPLCAQSTFALCKDTRNLFGSTTTPEEFESGRVIFPVSNISDIASNLRHQEEFHREGFPAQWLYSAYHRGPAMQGRVPFSSPSLPPAQITNGGSSVVSGLTLPPIPRPLPPNPFPTKREQDTASITSITDALYKAGINDDIHPIIGAVTVPYFNKRGNMSLRKVLDNANVTWDHLPSIPKFMAGKRNNLCYNWVMGYCQLKSCTRKHAKKQDVPDAFAAGIVHMLKPGFDYMANVDVPAGSKRKADGSL